MSRRPRSAQRDAKADAQSGTEPLDFNAAPRAAQALRLRRLGSTYAQIAQQCGYANESGARKAIKAANARIIRDEATALVGWQLDMLDQALQVVMKRIVADTSDSLWAIDRLTPLLKRQSELMGLDVERKAALQVPVIFEVPQPLVAALRGQRAVQPVMEASGDDRDSTA